MTRTLIAITLASLAGAVVAFQKTNREIVAQGEILAVSTEERTVTLEEIADPAENPSPDAKQSGVVRKFDVDEGTALTEGRERIELADIDVGARATVRYITDSGRNVAVTIEIRSPATD